MDLVIATVGLVVTLPVMTLIAVAIRLTSPGQILYRGTRAGLMGAPFQMLKFRTMVPDAENLGGSVTSADDERITEIGAFLRRYKLDELPQLINVIKGEMSIVGPRPEVFHYVNEYSEHDRRVLSVIPGLTDWASLWDIDEGHSLKGCANPDEVYAQQILPMKLALQNYYLDHRSVMEDLRIIFYTIIRIMRSDYVPQRLRDVMNAAAKLPTLNYEVIKK